MDASLAKDMEILIIDTEKVKKRIECLEKENCRWDRYKEYSDLLKIMERIKRLEFDLILLIGDSVSINDLNSKIGIMRDLHHACEGLETLFHDFKTVWKRIDYRHLNQIELQKIKIDLAKFRKAVKIIEKDIEQIQ